jgi:sulfur carrier protein ThiS
MSFNALVSVAIDQESTYQDLLDEEETNIKRAL